MGGCAVSVLELHFNLGGDLESHENNLHKALLRYWDVGYFSRVAENIADKWQLL